MIICTCVSGPSQPHVVFNALDGGQVRPLQSITYHDNDNNTNETSGIELCPLYLYIFHMFE